MRIGKLVVHHIGMKHYDKFEKPFKGACECWVWLLGTIEVTWLSDKNDCLTQSINKEARKKRILRKIQRALKERGLR